MKYPLLALILALAASCAPAIPRAILPPPSEVKPLDVAPVSKATDKTRDAVREIASAGNASREASRAIADTSIQLRAAIDRAEILSRAKGEMEDAFAEIQRFSLALSADVARLKSALELAEQKEAIAIDTVDSLASEVSSLRESTAAQKIQIRHAQATEATLREKIDDLSASSDKLAIAEEKLEWWRKAALLTWAILILLTVGGALLRRAGRFPF